MECKLVNVSGDFHEPFPVKEGRTTIGRDSDNDIQLTSDNVSRYHALLENYSNVCELKDLKSSNGTFVNTVMISNYILRNGDEIRIGTTILRFENYSSLDDGFMPPHDYSERMEQDTIKVKIHTEDGKNKSKGLESDNKPISPLQPIKPLQPKS